MPVIMMTPIKRQMLSVEPVGADEHDTGEAGWECHEE